MRVNLAHGAGGKETRDLIDLVFKDLISDELKKCEDAAVIAPEKLAVSTDGFTVSPIFFAGGDIGKLAVAGSCNDVAMMGARPLYLTASFIIEEGFLIDNLRKIVASFADELALNGAKLISADTKVVPKGSCDGIFITTTALGKVEKNGISPQNLAFDDYILASGSAGDHGATIFTERNGFGLNSTLKSDCKSLWSAVAELLSLNIIALRDATRGGLAAVLNEWATTANLPITVLEEKIAVKKEVLGACEFLGFEPYSLANEGMMIVAVRGEKDAQKALEILLRHDKNANIIGHVTGKYASKVVLKTAYKTARFLDMPSGELLPRIC